MRKREEARIARGTAIDLDSRLRVGRAIAKTEEEVAPELMSQVKRHARQPRSHQLWRLMEKERLVKQCCKHGERFQKTVDEENHQHSHNQPKTGTISRWSKSGRKGSL